MALFFAVNHNKTHMLIHINLKQISHYGKKSSLAVINPAVEVNQCDCRRKHHKHFPQVNIWLCGRFLCDGRCSQVLQYTLANATVEGNTTFNL